MEECKCIVFSNVLGNIVNRVTWLLRTQCKSLVLGELYVAETFSV